MHNFWTIRFYRSDSVAAKNRGESATDRALKNGPGKDFAAGSVELSPAPPHFPVFSIQKARQMQLNNITFSTWVCFEILTALACIRQLQPQPGSEAHRIPIERQVGQILPKHPH